MESRKHNKRDKEGKQEERNKGYRKGKKLGGEKEIRKKSNLLEANLGGVSAEALTAHVDTVLADHTVPVTTGAAMEEEEKKEEGRKG